MISDIIDFIHDTRFSDTSENTQTMATLCILDLIGVGIAGATTELSKIIRNHSLENFNSEKNKTRLLFDGRYCSPAGCALAGGMTIDSMDAHDGFNDAKGHIGCGLFPATLALADATNSIEGHSFLTDVIIGYELGSRLATSLHGTVSDYHTSGAWISIAVAAIGARRLGLTKEKTKHALGIAEYHGPRSQMMRCIDHPTMLKDGSGFGAMAGVSAAYLAKNGFSGAPAITMDSDGVISFWKDLGQKWLIKEQYFKPYPVCRWAQAPIEAVLQLKHQYNITSKEVKNIEIHTFHEAIRLAISEPKTTEEAQYSTSYPCAVALVNGDVGVKEVSENSFREPETLRISKSLKMVENEYCNSQFPTQRFASAKIELNDGRILETEFVNPRWTAEHPPKASELKTKFFKLSNPIIGKDNSKKIEFAVNNLKTNSELNNLTSLLYEPIDGNSI